MSSTPQHLIFPNNKMFRIKYSGVWIASLLFMSLPVWLFLLTYIRLVVAIPVCVLAVIAFLFSCLDHRGDARYVEMPWHVLLILVLTCGLWCYLGGQGGLFYQTSDWNERNAIFRDLITHTWPVYYPETDTMLTYYIGHWLPAAAVSHAYLMLTGNAVIAWRLGRLLLGLWTMAGTILAMLLLMFRFKQAPEGKWQLTAIAFFVFFSGLDVVGCLLQKWTLQDFFTILHLEWWSSAYQFSSNTTCLFWVFNQAVTAWIATLCFLNEKKARNYAYIIVCAFLSSPLPCVGLGIYMIGAASCEAYRAMREKRFGGFVRDVLTVQNILPVLSVFPILAAYFLTNSATEKTISEQEAFPPAQGAVLLWFVLFAGLSVLAAVVWKKRRRGGLPAAAAVLCLVIGALSYLFPPEDGIYPGFVFLEAGIFLCLLWRDEKREPIYYLTWFIFLLSPLIKIGIGADFCMRASIPAVMTLMTMCMRSLHASLTKWRAGESLPERVIAVMLCVCLALGAVTPCMEIYRGVRAVYEAKSVYLAADEIYTLDKYHESGGIYGNFVSDRYGESVFYKYLSAYWE